ncbi:hypothetical protein COLO4_05339 [Corchorus olitorius]|uniref:Uncharacterized protein n=1 Tax=Corchorus olitorius TaxID=93759 RepID=A0A1R3KR66_9ROSI|nr:hypothetical protein COLO4_05339 [Corchorus olitorius]
MDDNYQGAHWNVVHAVGGLSARVSQLDSRTCQVENAVGDLKDSVVFNHGRIEVEIRELGNSLEEVFFKIIVL